MFISFFPCYFYWKDFQSMQDSFILESYNKWQKHYRLLSIVQDCSSSTFHIHSPHYKQDFLHFLLTWSSGVLAVLGHRHPVREETAVPSLRSLSFALLASTMHTVFEGKLELERVGNRRQADHCLWDLTTS